MEIVIYLFAVFIASVACTCIVLDTVDYFKNRRRQTNTYVVELGNTSLIYNGTNIKLKKTPCLCKKCGDPTSAHVYADWLEEHGCPREYTDALRKEFPLKREI